ncbi:MAG: YecA family protein [Bacillota bacterium]
MADKQTEAAVKNMLSGLHDMKEDFERKRYKKLWSEMSVPFTLHDALSKYKKHELDDIRKMIDIQGVSSLKKAELQEVLEERILALGGNYLRWDAERLELLIKIARNGGHLPTGDLGWEQVDYFRETGLIYSGTINGKHSLAIPQELIHPILEAGSDASVQSIIKRNTEWLNLTRGLLYYYGTLSVPNMIDMLEKYTKKSLPLREYFYVIHERNLYRKGDIISDDEGYSDTRIIDSKRVKQEHRSRSELDYYNFTKEQLLKAGTPDYIERNQSYFKLLDYLLKNFDIDRDEADSLVKECAYAARAGIGPNQVLEFLGKTFEFGSMEALQEVMNHVVHLMNNTREWFLKGHTSTELSTVEMNHLRALPSRNSQKEKEVIKIGRNEPCTCGSGKKYKKCCGG